MENSSEPNAWSTKVEKLVSASAVPNVVQNDICLIKTKMPICFNEDVSPICIGSDVDPRPTREVLRHRMGTTVDRFWSSGEDCRINELPFDDPTFAVRPATGRSQAVRFRSMQGGTGVGAGLALTVEDNMNLRL
ncbi:hypothetical protein BV898_16862 [Hypsibius exemplaris]|uniref:Uncharacterized protein n=1 Tax=Hypsibius exemplaris TaxID=2072580 RepID=A0A9X6NEG6_HYPEX|nr:hypothetical protein BV898_16862 [Hypsibius exemplaris]